MDSLDGYGIAISSEEISKLIESGDGKKTRVRKSGGKFIKGPIPVEWLQRANLLGGPCSALATALWFGWGISKGAPFRVTHGLLNQLGVNLRSGRRALSTLESAGLVSVKRGRGRCPVVTILELEEM